MTFKYNAWRVIYLENRLPIKTEVNGILEGEGLTYKDVYATICAELPGWVVRAWPAGKLVQ